MAKFFYGPTVIDYVETDLKAIHLKHNKGSGYIFDCSADMEKHSATIPLAPSPFAGLMAKIPNIRFTEFFRM